MMGTSIVSAILNVWVVSERLNTLVVNVVLPSNLRVCAGRWSSGIALAVSHQLLHEDAGQLCMGSSGLLFPPWAFGFRWCKRYQRHIQLGCDRPIRRLHDTHRM